MSSRISLKFYDAQFLIDLPRDYSILLYADILKIKQYVTEQCQRIGFEADTGDYTTDNTNPITGTAVFEDIDTKYLAYLSDMKITPKDIRVRCGELQLLIENLKIVKYVEQVSSTGAILYKIKFTASGLK